MRTKIKIFDEDKALKTLKIITLAALGILFLWFTFDMTGLRMGAHKIVTSAFTEAPLDFVFWLLYVVCLAFFIFKEKIGKYLITVFVLVWGILQYTTYIATPQSIAQYNDFFSDTHHMIPASNDFLIKDTYHIFLDIFIFFAIVFASAYLIVRLLSDKRGKGEVSSAAD